MRCLPLVKVKKTTEPGGSGWEPELSTKNVYIYGHYVNKARYST